MSKAAIEVRASSIRIVELEVSLKEVACYFRSIPAEERVFTLTKAIEVGVFCLERGRTAQDTDFVKRKITELLTDVEQAVTAIPTKAEEALVKKMGTAEGQVLSPVKRLIDDAAKESTRRIGELKSLLTDDLDPKNAKSTQGFCTRFRATQFVFWQSGWCPSLWTLQSSLCSRTRSLIWFTRLRQ
jgi:hypothetical protein